MGVRRDRRRSPNEARFVVGARVRLYWASHPLGRLVATRDQIAVSAVLGKAVLDRAHVTTVYTTRNPVRRVIAFRTDDHSGDWVWVYSFAPYRILAALEELGWEVGL
jgi:hypothetical protein